MEWTDDGIVLSVRPHGESGAVVGLLTRDHGRHAGMVRGGTSKRLRGVLEVGNRVTATWRARLSDHLGTFTVEPSHPYAAAVLADPLRLSALSAVCSVADLVLPEREPHPAVAEALNLVLDLLEADHPAWPSAVTKWEMGLLAELGYGLDLTACAATGRNDQLAYVSPKSGRAVSLAAAEPYRDKLLALPAYLIEGGGVGDWAAVADGLKLTGYFLERCLFDPLNRGLPPARHRLAERISDRARSMIGSQALEAAGENDDG